MSRDNIIYSDQKRDICRYIDDIREIGWGDAKTRIRPFLAPTRWEKMIDMTPQLAYSRFLDLSVYYYIPLVSDDGKKLRIAWIDHMTLTTWGITMQTLKEQAIENLYKDGYAIQCIDGIINGLLGSHTIPHDTGPIHLYVLTNKKMFLGASGILDRGIIRSSAERIGHNLHVIPSSIHETLLCPDLGQIDKEKLDRIIKEINDTQVAPQDRLSDHAYYYDRAMDEIRTEQ